MKVLEPSKSQGFSTIRCNKLFYMILLLVDARWRCTTWYPGVPRGASNTNLDSWYIRTYWDKWKKLQGEKIFSGATFHIPTPPTLNKLLHCSLWEFSGALFWFSRAVYSMSGVKSPGALCIFFPGRLLECDCVFDTLCIVCVLTHFWHWKQREYWASQPVYWHNLNPPVALSHQERKQLLLIIEPPPETNKRKFYIWIYDQSFFNETPYDKCVSHII